MDRLSHVIEITKSSYQHLPPLLSFLAGLLSIKRDSFLFIDEGATGDNIPMTLIPLNKADMKTSDNNTQGLFHTKSNEDKN